MLHVDHFKCMITERGRSKVVEEPGAPEVEVGEALIVLSCVEKGDEASPEAVAERGAFEVANLASRLKVGTVVLHPFAHLFGELAGPEVAVRVLKAMEEELRLREFSVYRTPFGWFNTLEIGAKGHPLSRVARMVSAS